MKVAIIGAGLAGLSCAYELEKYGVKPVIYETNSYIGEQYPHVGGALEIATRPIRDVIKYFKNRFDIDIQPLNTVNRIIHHSPRKTTEIRGNLGYLLSRSKEPEDLKIQIHSKLKSTHIHLSTFGDYETLSKQNDFVVIANGRNDVSNELGCWFDWVYTHVRSAVVLGRFDPNTIHIWVNKDYCKDGYAYLTPFNDNRASLNLVVTDVNEKEIGHCWELFLFTENIRYHVVEEFTINHRSGWAYPHRIGNLFLAGNAGGVIDPFLGFGVLGAIVTGVMSARSITQNQDYEKQIRWLVKSNIRFYEFRKALNATDNKGFDKIITAIGLPGFSQLLYNTPVNVVKYGSLIFKLMRASRYDS